MRLRSTIGAWLRVAAAWVILLGLPARAETVAPFLKRSDVLLSPRFARGDWREQLARYHVNRIMWTYAPKKIEEDLGSRFGSMTQCALPTWVPASASGEMACKTSSGAALSKSFQGVSKQTYPDVEAPAWRDYIAAEAARLVQLGCRNFTQDNAPKNLTLASQGGCFHAGEGKDPGPEIARSARGKSAILAYHAWLKHKIQTVARESDPRADITYSANLTNRQFAKFGWLATEFDFLTSEIYADRETGFDTLQRFARATRSLRQPSAVVIASDDVWFLRRAIATAYALGLVPVVPWDVFVGPDKPRFFGRAEDFAPLYRLVQDNKDRFDDFLAEDDAPSPAAGAPPPNLVLIAARGMGSASSMVAHVINWGDAGRVTVELEKSQFANPPGMIATETSPEPKPVTIARSDAHKWYVEIEDMHVWAILF